MNFYSNKYQLNFAYAKWGHCDKCDNDDCRLYKPKFEGDTRVVLFEPICRKCAE